jgi:hypothetical protein
MGMKVRTTIKYQLDLVRMTIVMVNLNRQLDWTEKHTGD